MKKIAKLKLTPWMAWVGLLVTVIAAGVAAGLMVFVKGLSLTNLTDMVPWGLWITIDLSSIAISAGAFSLCAAVYLLGLKRYQPLARTATFIGLIGYTMALLTLLMDIGRPDRFWHAVVYWNRHSLLWEVTMCVTLYLAVLALEAMPIFAQFEWLRTRLPRLAARMERVHHYAPYLAIVGLGLSMLHQSSLGAVYGVLKSRPLWYRPDISILFIVSAVAGGMALTVFASMLSARITRRANIDDGLLERVAYFIGWILVGYLYFRFWDALSMTYTYEPGRTEGLRMLTSGPFAFNFWIGEMLLGAVVPILLLLRRRTRQVPFWRMLALLLVVGGVVAYRWDTNLSGQLIVLSYLPGEPAVAYTHYVPSLIEFASGAGVVAYGLLAFSLGVRYLGVVNHEAAAEEHFEEMPAREALPAPTGD
ncbi:MAG: polysulfide reductase NrfD [Anaerolineales bacterium]|nr:polysulfide reductase NrfD [Anaerolineales bacterium]